jgi:3-hydroxyacyl-[acyl-carrier-protein] dehydratase
MTARQATQPGISAQDFAPSLTAETTPKVDDGLRDALKRYSPATREAACQFRRTGNAAHLPAIVQGIIEHCVEHAARDKLARGGENLRLVEDLGIDSLTMLEIVFLAEEVLEISIENEEVRTLRTVGEVQEFIASKLGAGPARRFALPPGRPELGARAGLGRVAP